MCPSGWGKINAPNTNNLNLEKNHDFFLGLVAPKHRAEWGKNQWHYFKEKATDSVVVPTKADIQNCRNSRVF